MLSMKLLFVLDYIYSGESTNVRLAQSIAFQLQNKGHDVWFLCNCKDSPPGLPADRTIVFCCEKDRCTYETINTARSACKSLLGLSHALLKRPAALLNLITTVLLKKSMAERSFQRQIEQADRLRQFDTIISVSCPHYTMFALAQSTVAAQKVAYMVDPYWSNKTMPYAVSLKRELRFYQTIDMAIITNLMYQENLSTPLRAYKSKMSVLPFPGIKPSTAAPFGKAHGGASINCLFIGNLYAKIRNPEFIFRFAEQVDGDICFTFVGGGHESFPTDFFSGYQQRLGNRLRILPPVESETADRMLQEADVLINIGNSIENQLPSKIFDYFNTGKPIANFFRIDNCPSLPYFEKYPMSINIKEGDLSAEIVQKFNEFCHRYCDTRIDYATVEHLYPSNTVTSVADQFEVIISE